jgi:hypothetical protein
MKLGRTVGVWEQENIQTIRAEIILEKLAQIALLTKSE